MKNETLWKNEHFNIAHIVPFIRNNTRGGTMKRQHWLWFIDRRKGVQCFLLQGETLESKVN